MESGFSKKLIRSKSGLRIVSSSENYLSPLMLTEPPWIPDKEVPHCTECGKKFDFITRRHHCRRCGHVYCNACCARKVSLPRMCFVDPVRVCEACAAVTHVENAFFDRQLKTLLNGGTFFLDLPPLHDSDVLQYVTCKLSSDHRRLIIEGANVEEMSPLELTSIKSFGISKDDNNGASSISLLYLADGSAEQRLKLSSAPEPHRRAANGWIAALQEAFKLVHQRKLTDDK